MAYRSLLLLSVLVCGCYPGPTDDSGRVAGSVTHDATVAYSVLCAEVYEEAAVKLRSGELKTDREFHTFMKERLELAKSAAFQAVHTDLQSRAGATADRPWDAGTTAAVADDYAKGHREVR